MIIHSVFLFIKLNEHLAADSGGYVCTNSLHIHFSMAQYFPDKVSWCSVRHSHVSQGGMSKGFEQS